MKKLENFINENRDAFDSYEPGHKVWQHLEKQLNGKDTRKNPSWRKISFRWTAAAAVILLIALPAIYYITIQTKTESGSMIEVNETLPEEYEAEVSQYTHAIAIKYKELNKIRKEEPVLYNKFSSDIKKLDSSYQMLKKDLAGNPNESILIEAMIQNLNYQVELLNEQLLIINKIRKIKKSQNEKVYKSL